MWESSEPGERRDKARPLLFERLLAEAYEAEGMDLLISDQDEASRFVIRRRKKLALDARGGLPVVRNFDMVDLCLDVGRGRFICRKCTTYPPQYVIFHIGQLGKRVLCESCESVVGGWYGTKFAWIDGGKSDPTYAALRKSIP